MKLFFREYSVIKLVVILNCIEVSLFKKGIVCKLGDIIYIFNSLLEL